MPPRPRLLIRFPTMCALVLLLLVALAGPGGANSPEERRLQETKAKIDRVRDQIESARGNRDADAAALAEAQAQLVVVLAAVNEAELAVQRQQQAVDAAGDELARLEAEGARQREVTSNRAVELYRQGASVPFASILSADSTGQAIQRSTFVDLLSRADREAFELVEIAQVAIDAQRKTLEAEEATLERVAAQQRAILAEVDALRQERALVLAGSETVLANLQAEESHLEAESRELAALSRRAAQTAAAAAASRSAPSGGGAGEAAAPAAGSGGWTWPAGGPVTSGFGNRWGRMHEGIDIGASTGAAVVAANAGTVSFTGRMGGYGNLVLIDHGGGIVTAYAHLGSISVGAGASVGGGQRIGAVGCSGSCTGPHLHFEVRVNGAARNPMNYL